MPRRKQILRRQNTKHAKPKPLLPGHQKKTLSEEKKNKVKSKKHKQQQQHDQPTIPFAPHDRILLIGEGDLSFAASIIRHHGCTNVTATVLERDHEELCAKYPSVDANIEVIHRRPGEEKAGEAASSGSASGSESDEDQDGVEDEEKPPAPITNKLVYAVDATKLLPSISRQSHDHIIFNFPHVGGKSTDINRQVRHNQQLLVSFFQRALSPHSSPESPSPLAPGGTIIITLFEAEPYTLWNIRDLARHAGLQVLKSFRFQPDAYPGYRHARTLGVVRSKKTGEEGAGWKGEERAARSYVFVRKGEVEAVSKKRKRDGDDDSSSDED